MSFPSLCISITFTVRPNRTTPLTFAAHAPHFLSSFLLLLMIILKIEKTIFHIYPHIFTILGALQVYIYIISPRLIFTMLGAPQSSIFFPSAWRTSLHVSCSTISWQKILCFCLYNVFISPPILEDVTTEYRIQDWHFFLYFKDAIPLSFLLTSSAFLMSSLVILILFLCT